MGQIRNVHQSNFGQVIREGTFGKCRHTYEVNIKKRGLKEIVLEGVEWIYLAYLTFKGLCIVMYSYNESQ